MTSERKALILMTVGAVVAAIALLGSVALASSRPGYAMVWFLLGAVNLGFCAVNYTVWKSARGR